MKAYFDEFGHLRAEIEVKGALRSKAVSALIDTGFDGYICLPIEIAIQLGLTLFAYEPFELADGSRRRELVFLGFAQFGEGPEAPVEIVLTESKDTLIGIDMLAEMKMEADFKKRSLKVVESDNA